MSEDLKRSFNEGFKAGAEKFYPGYIAYEEYATELEGVIDGKNVVILEQEAEIQAKINEINALNTKVHNRNIGLAVGIPGGVVVGIIAGFLIKYATDQKQLE